MRIDNANAAATARRDNGNDSADVEHVFSGGGEMGALMRSIDWSQTELGPVSAWPQSLRTTVSTCLNSRFPILIWWGPHMVKLYNDAYRPMLGSKHPRAMGARGRDVWPEIWDIIGPMLDGVLREGKATWSENQLLLLERNGFAEECYFTFSYSPIRDERGIGGIFSAVTETTKQVLSERRLRTLRLLAERTATAKVAEDACVATAEVLATNSEDVPFALVYLVDSSAGVARLVGATGAESADYRDVLSLSPARGETHSLAEAARPTLVADVMREFGATRVRSETRAPKRAFSLPVVLPGDTSPSAFLVAGLSPRLFFDQTYKSFLDLVGRHLAAAIASARGLEEAQRRAEALAEIDRVKTAFFSNVSHEFRTPLTLMQGPSHDLLGGAHGELNDAQRMQVELIYRNSLRLQKLVNALLDFSRIEAGRIQASCEPLDLAALTSDLASSFRAAIERAGLRFDVDCPAIDDPVFVDRDMWEKIVLNLLSNALKFTFEGKIEVSLRCVNDHVELRVADTGVGVPDDQIPRLFERFHRVEGTRARTHEGSGIGLALVQELVKLHGGSIRAESRLGEGTTFVIELPKGRASFDAKGAAPARASTAVGAAPFVQEALRWLPDRPSDPPRSKAGEHAGEVDSPSLDNLGRILVADDNADMRDYIRRLLEPYWIVDTVADGVTALERACAHGPDLILTDIMMPELDGFGLLRELRAHEETRHIPVVMLSARAGGEARIEGLQAGAEDYLVKPFSARELLVRVRTQIELAQSRRAAEAERDRLRVLLSQIPAIAVWGWDAEADCVTRLVPPSFDEEPFGSIEDYFALVHPDDRDKVRAAFRQSRQDASPYRAAFRMIENGRQRELLGLGFVTVGPSGAVRRIDGFNVDITEREHAEVALEAERKARLAEL